VRGRWRGRTPTNKLVFVESEQNLRGQKKAVYITWAGPWSMQGALPPSMAAENPLNLIQISA
jgi:tRNA-2-methylthio-N6-dimethylallyladenosine synthase